MSTSSVCQGLQSCLEPGVTEPRVLRLKLSLPSPNLYSVPPQPTAANDGLSFLQALAGPRSAAAEAESLYVHPMVKRSASALSVKSLDMCTESLGSETGGGDEMEMLIGEVKSQRQAGPWRREVRALKRSGRGRSFPPPLTSVSGSGGLKVRPHREDGRLVLTAIASPPSTSCFLADRTGGRLRLRLVSFETSGGDVDDVAAEEISGEDCSEEEEEEGEEETEALRGEGMDEKIESSGVKMVNDKLRRCKEEEACGNGKTVIWGQQRLVAT